ncbi:uncharacterized protein N0V89_000605 [Didymosphaeria variabile]|uniref:Linalool dehydratase/isomerase domain-containing protein n=1 Tax=Didymosphaeria variabile TaxID=1932322 RepID=A0A9W8XVI1_9PLEO|nr:uncharacterized protein N0V89_000605 [Didymosphaeria variabile]KAJ4360046.1 hypothetical protein N0V89_000605 [Didymosphaeria variabile]
MEWDTAYRYQIATMAYAAGAAHYHRLPAMRGMFKELLVKLIGKMLRREVWGYWYLTSQSGIRLNPDLKELRKPWADPVCKENIMYSGHLLLMISLYTMLFADDRFDKDDSIVFDWNPMFWGMGPEKFSYTRRSLQQAIVNEMEREKWIGVCCEPNLVFIVCNQFPLLAMRYNDVTDGTKVFDEVLPKYQAAWTKKNGFVGDNGLFRLFYATGQDRTIDSNNIAHTVWAMAFMSWNHEFVKSLYPQTGHGYLQRKGDRLNLNSQTLANKIRELNQTEGADPESPATVERAKALVAGKPPSTLPYMSPTFGYIAQWLSEVENGDDLAALLRHADAYLRPRWEKGGLYYERNEQGWDTDGNFTYGEAYTGNAGIGYARLNVKEGQRKMWEKPWSKADVERRPWVDGVALESGIDCLRGVWDEDERAMVVSLRAWDGEKRIVNILMRGLPSATWGAYIDGELVRMVEVSPKDDTVTLNVEVSGEPVDVVLAEVGKHQQ